MKSKIVIHTASTYPDMDIGADEIRAWHKARGWSDIGYHYVIRRDGSLEMGRDRDGDGNVLEETGAHAYGHNVETIGICLVGGKAANGSAVENYTPGQWRTLKSLVFLLHEIYPEARIMGHYQLNPSKTCPNFDVPKWLLKIGLK